jgi:multiple sugar transport system ATP-binding protein
MNVLPAVAGGAALRVGPFELPLPGGFTARAGGGLEVGVRPAAVRIDEPGGGEPATVELVEVAGEDAYVHLRSGGVRLVATVPAQRRPEPGKEISVSIDPGALFIFDADTGRTLAHPA